MGTCIIDVAYLKYISRPYRRGLIQSPQYSLQQFTGLDAKIAVEVRKH